MKPWSGEHAAGRITRPLRSNLIPYQGINILMLWGAAMEKGYGAPIWLTFKQAQALGGRVRKGEHGSLVVFASTFTRTEADEKTGDEAERDIPFLKSYTVFNAEQIDGLPAEYLAPAAPRSIKRARTPRVCCRHGYGPAFATRLFTGQRRPCRCRSSRRSAMRLRRGA
jgi:antirestriction protein ArdC